MVLSGVVVSCVVFYLVGLFYNTLPGRLEVFFGPPSDGSITPQTSASAPARGAIDDSRPFSFAPDRSTARSATWTAGGSSAFSVSCCLRIPRRLRQQVAVALVSGCTSLQDIQSLADPAPWRVLSNIELLEASFDPGLAMFYAPARDEKASRILASPGSVAFFNFNQDKQDEQLTITQFVRTRRKVGGYADRG